MTKYLLCFLFLFTSCSSLRFQARENTAITNPLSGSESEKVVVKGQVVFYAWGHYPPEHIINIDDEFKKKGFSFVGKLYIEEYQTFFNRLLTILSFGMYNAKNFRFTAHAIKESNLHDF